MTESNSKAIAFVGGRVWTDGYTASRDLDVLVVGDVIADVAPAGHLKTDGAEIRDIKGKLLTPGIQDAHIHMGLGGNDLLTCDLTGMTDGQEILDRLGEYARENPELPWIIAGGWPRDAFPDTGPTAGQLDSVIGDRPAYIAPFDRHGGWVSSAALRLAGIDETTPNPEGGVITRDQDGRPTGMLEETAVKLVRGVMPEITHNDQIRAILRAQEHVLSLGITSIQDALVGTGLGIADLLEPYCDIVSDGRLRLRLTTALWWEPSRGLEQIPELVERRRLMQAAGGVDRVRADMIKMMIDGSDQLFVDEDMIREATVALDAEGFSVHYHSYGDSSTHWILNAVEAAIATNGPRERRHHIAHLVVVADEDVPRFGRLGVTVNAQGEWLGTEVPHDHLHHTSHTDDPEDREYPYGRIRAAGARLAAGSDWPVTTADALVVIAAADDRLPVPGYRDPLDIRDRVEPTHMLSAYTVGSAFVNGRPHETGRIAPGFKADLALFDREIFDAPASVDGAVVEETWIDGIREYSRA